jgi:hypothetical protein
MTPDIRKLALTAHIISSVGWIGAVASFEALAISGLASRDPLTVRAAYVVMESMTCFVIVPFAFASLLTGLVLSLGTKWGLFRHYWILAKFLINIIGVVILLVHTRLISIVAGAAADRALIVTDLRGMRIQLVAIASAALLSLLAATTLAVFKPRGVTPYGQHKQQKHRRETKSGA